ncbi:MAG: PAS domain S-box protein [Candidatus Krumholzibacteriia bacterium]
MTRSGCRDILPDDDLAPDLALDDGVYRQLFAALEAGLAVAELVRDEQGRPCDIRVLDANPAFGRLLRIAPARAVGRTVRDLSPHAEKRWFERCGQVVDTGEPTRFRAEASRLDRWFDVSVFSLGGERFAVLLADATERQRTEKALREVGDRFHSVLENSRDVVYRRDLLHDRYDFLSPAIERITGIPAAEFALLPATEVIERIHPDDRDHVDSALTDAMERGEGTVEYRFRCDDDVYRWLADSFTVQRDDEGQPRYRGGSVRDVTARKEAERALTEAHLHNARNLAQMDAVLNQMTDGLVVFDPDGRLLAMNPAARDLHGVKGDSLQERDLEDMAALFQVTDLDGRRLPTQHWPFGRALRGEWFDSYEVRVVRHESGESWIGSYGGTPVLDDSGRMILAVVTVRDVTDRYRTEQRLRELTADLERQVFDRTKVLEKQTYHLRRLATELTVTEQRERRRLADFLHDHLQQLLVAGKMRLSGARASGDSRRQFESLRMVDGLLDECLHASRSLTAELRPAVLHDDDVLAALRWLAEQMRTRHGLEVTLEADCEPRLADERLRVLLFESVRELLFNVVKHAGVESARVEVRTIAPDHLQVTVSDAGSGFAGGADVVVNSPGHYGLFSIRERLYALGGRLTVHSEPGAGTTMTLVVPLGDAVAELDHPHERIATRPRGSKKARATKHGPVRVLLVDDHAIVREGLANLLDDDPRLEVAGQAGDGQDALDWLHQHEADVALMDVNMPRLDGVRATAEIARRWPDIAVVGLSIQDDPGTEAAMRDAGARDYLNKAGDPGALVRAILAAAGRGGDTKAAEAAD